MSHDEYKSETCLNCGYQFKDKDNYCPDCGQANHSLKIPFKHLVLEVLEGTIHLDTKIFRTFKGLILQPGLLTREFNLGKRVTYVPPIRIYIFVSFIFFLLAGILSGIGSASHEKKHGEKKEKNSGGIHIMTFDNGITEDISQKEIDSICVANGLPKGMNKKQYDSVITSRVEKQSEFVKFVFERSKKANEDGGKEFNHSKLKYISYNMFFMMPLFAWFVFLFHLKQGHYYYEFLIYSIHFHSFQFLLFVVYIIITIVWDSEYLLLLILLISLYYLIVSMKNSFPQKTSTAVWKSVAVFIIYGITLGISLLGTLLFTLYMI